MSLLVSPLSAIAQAHNPTLISSVALRKGPRRFCPHRSDRCSVLMLTYQNAPLWQCCERCNNVLSSFWPPWPDGSINWTACCHVTCALIWTSRAYNYASSRAWTTLEYELVDTNWGLQKVGVEPATRSAVATWTMLKLYHTGNRFQNLGTHKFIGDLRAGANQTLNLTLTLNFTMTNVWTLPVTMNVIFNH